jgi:hypothetical protein
MKYYYSTVDNVVLTHSDLLIENSQRTVYVRFERPNKKGFDFAECSLPFCAFNKTCGFTEDELFILEDYLQHNSLLIWDYAQKGGGLNA